MEKIENILALHRLIDALLEYFMKNLHFYVIYNVKILSKFQL